MSNTVFGKEISSNDYLLYIENLSGPIYSPEMILGHSMTNPNQEISDALTTTRMKLRNGRMQREQVVVRGAEKTSETYTIGLPSSITTRVRQLARNFSNRKITMYLKYLCPDEDRYAHARIFPDASLGQPVLATALVTTTDDTEIINETVDITGPGLMTLYRSLFTKVTTVGSTELNGVAFVAEECGNASAFTSFGQILIALGGDGIAAGAGVRTTDRFASTSSPTLNLTAGDYVHDVFADGSLVLAVANDAADTSATAGVCIRSANAGVSFADVSDVVLPMFAITKVGTDGILLVGKTAAGAASGYYSSDQGRSFTQLTSSNLPAATTLVDAAYDESTGYAYAVGGDKLLRFAVSGSTVSVTDISANLPGSPSGLAAVAVLGPDIVSVGGASGYIAESVDGGDNFGTNSLGVADAVTAIGGTHLHTIVGAGTALYERSVVEDDKLSWTTVTLDGSATLTGNVTDITEFPSEDLEQSSNLFVVVTDDGEIVVAKPNTELF